MKPALLIAFLTSTLPLCAGSFLDSYKLETIKLPDGIPAEVGGLAFDPDGKLYVSLRRSDVLRANPVADPNAFDWKLFASGFHNGCGIVAPESGKILVSQMAELTSATDTDGDGVADSYRNVADGWGLSGNYHETNDICPDGKGGYFLAIGTASYNGPTFEHTKGKYSELGRRGRNYSSVQYRGWIMHLDKTARSILGHQVSACTTESSRIPMEIPGAPTTKATGKTSRLFTTLKKATSTATPRRWCGTKTGPRIKIPCSPTAMISMPTTSTAAKPRYYFRIPFVVLEQSQS